MDKDGGTKNTRRWVTSFAPGSTKFVTTVVKVHGTMKASVVTESGGPVLRITVDYLFVYAVEPPGDPADWMRVVQQQYGTVDFARWDDQGSSFEPWYNMAGSTSGVQCSAQTGTSTPTTRAARPTPCRHRARR